jgi:phosphatidate cytidylyltransferase
MTSNLAQRVISGAVLIVVALALTFAGGVFYRVLAAAIAGAVLYEWLAMTAPDAPPSQRWLAIGLLAVLLALLLGGSSPSFLAMALGGAVFVTAAHAVKIETGFWPTLGLAYAGAIGVSLSALRGADAAGLYATLFLFAVVWTTDIAAFFVGRAIGGPKLAPSISPGKTWSGALGGAAIAILAGTCVASAAGSALGWGALAGLALALTVASQAGDLFESAVKRRFGAKDSSRLIPGHGGVMDRVDGLATAAFVLFLLGAVLAGPDAPALAFFAG